jgi:hypothetical protein
MTPAPAWTRSMEWPKLDLPKSQLTHLALAWSVPFSPVAAAAFGGLLSVDGSFYGALSYQRGRVRHLRIEAAQLVGAEGDSLTVTVQYLADTGTLGAIPKFLQEGAWLLDALMQIAVDTPVRCQAGFRFPSSEGLQTAFPLPFRMPDAEGRFELIDEIRGIRGAKQADFVNPDGYTFTLDCLDDAEISLILEFSIAPGPAGSTPQTALSEASLIARRLVFHPK